MFNGKRFITLAKKWLMEKHSLLNISKDVLKHHFSYIVGNANNEFTINGSHQIIDVVRILDFFGYENYSIKRTEDDKILVILL